MALRRVVGRIMDGNHFKSAPSIFSVKVKPELAEHGGAVGFWDETSLKLPVTKALYARPHARLNGGVAVPDNGDPRYRWRLVYLSLRGGNAPVEVWATAASTDLEKVCKEG